MAPDDILRACAYLEAVWREETGEMAALLEHRPGETPTAVLVADLGDNIMQLLLPAQFGIQDGMPEQGLAAAVERMQADPTVRVSQVLIETLTAWAPDATPEQSETIARSLISYLTSISNATEDDVLPLLEALRQSALQRAADPGS
ncbi:hypothetical protein ACTWQF_33990 [Streptomyces sp. 8N114]|uniref:hypothetical protein n=1 Tax=Streptomyces sp. 8N114 TaxID=3457419 RepID=UPI003FD49428